MRTYWFSFTTGERTVPVYLTGELKSDTAGETRSEDGQIVVLVDRGMTREAQDVTMAHEFVHACLWGARLPLAQEERLVSALMRPMAAALRGLGFSWPARPGDFK